jgi:hypothetical protein
VGPKKFSEGNSEKLVRQGQGAKETKKKKEKVLPRS